VRAGALPAFSLLAVFLAGAFGLGIAGCSGGRVKDWRVHGLGSTLDQIQHRARAEGALDLVVRPGFPTRLPTADFTRQTGCQVSTTHAASLDLVASKATHDADGVLVAGDTMLRLIDSGAVAPVNYGLVPSYRDVVSQLKGQVWDTVDGAGYAVPQGRLANLELFRSDYLPSDTTSWAPIWSPSLRGHISIYDAPIFIADAALYLQSTRPSLHITNPYELDGRQFAVVARLLRRQRRDIGQFWNAATIRAQVTSFANGSSLVGTTWPRQVRLLNAEQPPVPITALKPVEGTTGWADAWMISAKPKHPNCMYLWLDYIVSPEANAREAQIFDEAPANATACEVTTDDRFCTDAHADDAEWWKDVRMWTVPQKDCGDARGDVCKSYADWQKAWAAIRAPERPSG
jgi:putative spermidine/putrescine transport system substrate-binding protein